MSHAGRKFVFCLRSPFPLLAPPGTTARPGAASISSHPRTHLSIYAMLALFVHGSQAFTGPTMHIAPQPTVRSSPVQMAEMSSRRAALLSAATLAVPFAASAATPFYKVNKAGISRPQGNSE